MSTEHATVGPAHTGNFPSAFFALTFVLSTPFYVLSAVAYLNVVGDPAIGPVYAASFTVAPIASAAILAYRNIGRRGVRELLEQIFDFKRGGALHALLLLVESSRVCGRSLDCSG